MRIGELGRATGVDIETIRYYEKAGLLPNPARSESGYRSYGPAHLERLAFIRHCRALERQLNALRGRCGESHHAGECGILHELVTAAHGEACACHVEVPFGHVGTASPGHSRKPKKQDFIIGGANHFGLQRCAFGP